QGLRQGRCRRGKDLRVRPPYRRDQRAAPIVADWNTGEQRLTVYQGTQAPHIMQNLFAKHLGLEEHQVGVVTKDVGGSFGIKVHTYADEMATVALSKLLGRPIKFVADRLESFVTDIH